MGSPSHAPDATEHAPRPRPHFTCRLPVILWTNGRAVGAHFLDAWLRGAFLATDEALDPRQEIRISAVLPTDQQPFTAAAVVELSAPPDRKAVYPPGAGITLLRLDREAATRWNRFVTHVHKNPGVVGDGADPGDDQRAFPRYPVDLELQVQTSGQLLTLHTRDVSAGGMFIVTDSPLQPGARLRVRVRYPYCDATFVLDAIVRRRAVPPERPGLGVEIVAMDDKRRSEFARFVLDALAAGRKSRGIRSGPRLAIEPMSSAPPPRR